MAGAEDGETVEAFNVATWRIVTLFLLLLFVDAVIEIVDESLTHYLKHNPESSHVWAQLKFETMALGVVSLLLVVSEVCAHINVAVSEVASGGPPAHPTGALLRPIHTERLRNVT
jgi:hypothetical protein